MSVGKGKLKLVEPAVDEGYHLQDQVGFILRKASQRHIAIFARHIDDLTPPQFAALAKLAEIGETSQNQLGAQIAMDAATIKGVIDRLKARGTPFAPSPPATYYEMLEERLPGHGEPVAELQSRGILLDGSTEEGDPRLLLQIFSQTQIGPVFFEFIQRKKDEGFGEGNFTALFKSMEADQLRRGALKVEDGAED